MKTTTTMQPESTKRAAAGRKWQDVGLPQLAKRKHSDHAAEIYDALLWRLHANLTTNKTMVVGLIGSPQKAGATTIAAKLAIHAAARQESHVLLIDAHPDSQKLQKVLRGSSRRGLFDVLSGEISPRECETEQVGAHLELLACGEKEANYRIPAQSEMVREMLDDFRADYNLIIVDLPPVDKLKSSLPLARELDGALLVVRSESARVRETQRLWQRLHQEDAPVLGAILNRHRNYLPQWLSKWF